ncbi:MAG TPA: ankyrin repeat domain-containing protein [Patescibacteria group bacterium]|nr:ankyrin repeat domain-containing protein [Patescibacteria group bacterium]
MALVARLIEDGADLSFHHPQFNKRVFDFLRDYSSVLAAVAHLPQIVGQDLVTTVASSSEDIDLVRSLLKDGPDLNQRDEQGRTPLMIAARNGFTGSVKEILRLDTDLLRTDKHGWTALMHAAMEGRDSAAQLLIDAGMPVTARSPSGYTALDLALVGDGIDEPLKDTRIALAKLLVENGASLHIPNEKGYTPLAFLRENGEHDAIRLLTAAEAQYQVTLVQTAVVKATIKAPNLARFRRAG